MTRYHFAGPASSSSAPIDLSEDDGDIQILFDRINLNDVKDTIDLSADDDDNLRQLTPGEVGRFQVKARSTAAPLGVPPGYRKQNSATTPTGVTIRPGTNVELDDGDFARITQVVKHHFTGELLARGILLRRTRRVNKFFKKSRNELSVVIQLPDDTTDDSNPSLDSSLIDVPLASIIQLRTIIFTNMTFPDLSYRHSGRVYKNNEQVEDQAELVVRWKYVEYYSLKDQRVKAGTIMHLTETEADMNKSTSDVAKYLKWREQESPQKLRSSASTAAKPHSKKATTVKSEPPTDAFVDLTMDEPESSTARKRNFEAIYVPSDSEEEITEEQQETIMREIKKRRNRDGVFTKRSESVSTITTYTVRKTKSISGPSSTRDRHDSLSGLAEEDSYTFGDFCAGAGGMSRSAEQAGLKHSFLLDHWEDACRTLRLNFPCARVLEQDIFAFCTGGNSASWMRVDVIHISFPCQTYSAAHTRPIGTCPNDDANEATGYSVGPILKLTRPRVVTFEQTEGLFSRHPDSFAALIEQLTAMNYNVRWRVLQCDRYGNVQPRKRLFVIASW